VDQEGRRRHLVRAERARGFLRDQVTEQAGARRRALGVDDFRDQAFQHVGGFADLGAVGVVGRVDDE
jgi:hypothetical protein